MKKLFLYAIFFAALPALTAQTVNFTGTITNPKEPIAAVLDQHGEEIATFKLSEKNTFAGELKVTDGYYNFSHGKETTKMYLRAGTDVNISLDTEQFDETVTYSGSGANECNYLAKFYLLDENMGKKNHYAYYGKLDENAFLKLTDSLYAVKENLLKSTPDLAPNFVQLETKQIAYSKKERLYMYPIYHRHLTKDQDFEVSKDYPNPIAGLDFTDPTNLQIESYYTLVEAYFDEKLEAEKVKKNYFTRYLQLIDEDVKNPAIKEEILYQTTINYIGYAEDLEKFTNTFYQLSTSEAHKNEVKSLYNDYQKIAPGQPSPAFAYQSIDGQSVDLNSFKGKYVYIDVWATWCQPCLGEIPSLQKLEEEMHGKNIAFVSICTWDSEKRWRKMVAARELGGTQLFNPERSDEFINTYMITGIPRFILLDSNGNIIDADAKRPSNPELKKQLNKLLK